MNRTHLRYIVPLSVVAVLGIVIAANAQFNGPPCSSPQSCNVPGVIWNTAGTSEHQENANINFGTDGSGGGHPGVPNFISDVGIQPGRAIRADGVGATTLNMGNWGAGQQPFNLGIYGDLKVNRFAPFGAGRRGRVDAEEYCIAGANCISAWPSGGGGITSIANGGGLTVTNPSGPATTLSVIDNYVNTTGDTMTGNLTMTSAYPNTTNFAGYGGYFWGLYGAYARGSGVNARALSSYAGSDVTNGYAAYFDAQNALGTSYGLYSRGSSAGPAGYFVDSGGGRSVSLSNPSTNLALSVSGNTRLGGPMNDSTTVSGTLTLIAPTSQLCLGTSGGLPDCRTSWPSGGAPGGVSDGAVQFKAGATFNGDSTNFTWDNTNKRLLVGTNVPDASSAMTVKGQGVQTISLTANGTNWGVKAEGNARGLVANSTNGAGIESTGKTGILAVANGIASAPAYLDAAGTFKHTSINKYTYIGTRTADEIYTQGNVHLDGYTDPLTYGNLILPARGGIGFDGNRDTTAMMSLNASNDIDLYLGTGGNFVVYPSAGGTSAYDFASNGSMLSRGSTAEYRYTDRANQANIWSLYSNAGWSYLYQAGNRFGVNSNGDAYVTRYLGIGTSAPTYQLQLSLNSAAKPGSNTWTITSDSRLKDVKGDYSKGLNEILKLNPITYSYKKDNPYSYKSDETYVGAIAQEVQKSFPEAVSKDSKGYLQLDTNSINWATINAIKELKAENDALKAQNETLEQRLEAIEYRLRNMQ